MPIIEDNEIIFFKNKTAIEITAYLTERLKIIDKKEKILYLYSHVSKQLISNSIKCLKNNIILVNGNNLNIDSLESRLKNVKTRYVYVNYFNLTYNKGKLSIENQKLKCILDIFENYKNIYNVIFIIAINWEQQ